MRLTPSEIEAIRHAAREVFGADAVVRVFGSRLDDSVKGGDLDLYLEVDPPRATLGAETEFCLRIAPALDDLKVDVLLHPRGEPLTPIERIAAAEGVEL